MIYRYDNYRYILRVIKFKYLFFKKKIFTNLDIFYMYITIQIAFLTFNILNYSYLFIFLL